MAELVDAPVSGTGGETRGGSSPLLGTNLQRRKFQVSVAAPAFGTRSSPLHSNG